jgi:exonuclease III
MDTLIIATLNINGQSSSTRVTMLEAFIRLHDIDILLLQEVTLPLTLGLSSYHVYYNIGTTRRGTAIIARDTLTVTNIAKLPSGRAIAAMFGTLMIVNIYAPSGTAKRLEREAFFNEDLPCILGTHSDDITLGGDFNCVLRATDATGQGVFSRSLATLVHGYALRDAWQPSPERKVYTHYTVHGASRLDRFYLTKDLLARKQSIETVAAAFTDHFAVVLRLSMDEHIARWGRGTWKLNCKLLPSNYIMETRRTHWTSWKQHRPRYPNPNMWWVRHCKPRLRQMFRHEEAERRSDHRKMENFYYDCIYDLIRVEAPYTGATPALNHLRAKIVNLNSRRLQSTMSDTEASNFLIGEQPTLYQLIRRRKRTTTRLVRSVRDGDGVIQTSPMGIAAAFVTYFQTKYAAIEVDITSVQTLAGLIRAGLPPAIEHTYEDPFTLIEIRNAISSGGQNRAPGRDGLGLSFYKATWTTICDDFCLILNAMFFDGAITTQQKLGTIVCLPKSNRMLTPADRRPITLLNSDYKIVTRILAQRLRPVIEMHLCRTQYCGVPGNTILDAVVTVRDTIAYAESMEIPMCVLALDFQQSFDKVSHDYLFTILRSYGLSDRFVTFIRNLYTSATSSVQINGRLYGSIPIICGVRQGCPLSMALYTLCLQPFLNLLEQRLSGVHIGRRNRPVSVVAYADDVTIFITSISEFQVVEDAIRLFEKASGALVNPTKSQALPTGRWPTSDTVFGIEYRPCVRILGVKFRSTIHRSVIDTWTYLTERVRTLAREAYSRVLCLAHRIQYAHTYLLAKIWYVAQIFPAPSLTIQHITSAVTYFLWRGAIF